MLLHLVRTAKKVGVRLASIKTRLLFDADMLLYIACQRNEKVIEWDDGLFTLHCYLSDATTSFDEHVQELTNLVLEHYNIEGEYEIIMCLSDDEVNFRKQLCDDYKANRDNKRRPVCYNAMRDWIPEHYTTLKYPRLEADDVIGITIGSKDIAISGDKDFKTIPCHFYDFMRNEYSDHTEEQANYWHLFQTLIGDPTDNYKGCPKVGEVKAKKILDEDCSWEAVVRAYEANGSDEETALLNARLAFILRNGYYNKKTKKVKLWTP